MGNRPDLGLCNAQKLCGQIERVDGRIRTSTGDDGNGQRTMIAQQPRAFHARLFAWLRYDLISRRSFLNDSTKF
ncbi:hypothetical protein N7457_003916 [Penicillium paradoxum]|uniref:uncharacterized protein n=1 Tax=Penicillium paradoxum TaxID=176176 RepID=UPI002548742D|nr:uncharacterized protein N7457_003916 [Penicillium paradoxum]KAJ5782142.1 hypothetical protein N7457_003916 [Penicillium paradoxum]